MDELMDQLLLKILYSVNLLKDFLDMVTSPLDLFGPAFEILILVFITIGATKIFRKYFKTKRYQILEKDYLYWYKLRQEAVNSENSEKGKLLAKNIDNAKLNKVYYDYFFEGFMNNLMTTYLPIFLMLAYVNEKFKVENFTLLFKKDYIFRFNNFSGEEVIIGPFAWFVLSVLIIYLTFYIAGKSKRFFTKKIALPV